jgi:hypothetical protein
MMAALVWPQRLPYKKAAAGVSESIEIASRPTCYSPARDGRSFRPGVRAREDVKEYAGHRGARIETELR